ALPYTTLFRSEPDDQRDVDRHLARRSNHAFGDDVATHDAAEDVDQNAFHCRVGEDDLEGRLHLLLRCATADVEEVGRLLAVELDDVHGRHREAGAIHHATDGPVELDVGEVVLGRLDFHRILFVEITQLHDLLVPVERVGIEIHLGVEAEELAVLGDDQRIDLEQAHVLFDEEAIEIADHLHALADLIPRKSKRERDLAAMEREVAGGGVDRQRYDLL